MLQSSHAHMLQTSSSNQTHVLVASNNLSLSRLEGRIYIITLLNSLPVLIILLNPLPVLVTFKILQDILPFTRIHDKYSPACWVSRKLRPKSKAIPCYTEDCFKLSCWQFVDTMFKVNVSGSATWLPICIANTVTQQTLRWLNCVAQMAFISSSVINLVYSYKANQTRFKCSLLF